MINKKDELEKKAQEKKLSPELINLVDNTERIDKDIHALKSGKSMYMPGFLSKLKTTNKEEIPGNYFFNFLYKFKNKIIIIILNKDHSSRGWINIMALRLVRI